MLSDDAVSDSRNASDASANRTGSDSDERNNGGAPPRPIGTLDVPMDTTMRIELLTNLSTDATQRGDRFEARIIEPREYEGARVVGRIKSVKRAGRVRGSAELQLDFEQISLPDGRFTNFNAQVIEVVGRGNSGVGDVDEEGGVRGRSTVKDDVAKVGAGRRHRRDHRCDCGRRRGRRHRRGHRRRGRRGRCHHIARQRRAPRTRAGVAHSHFDRNAHSITQRKIRASAGAVKESCRLRGGSAASRVFSSSSLNSMSLITLLTDFGTTDYFVGAMKGAILSVNPQARIVDLTHDIPAHDIEAGAFTLCAAYEAFPGTHDSCGGG
jgi:hypothetical protein